MSTQLATLIPQIVDAAIESTMAWYGLHGDVSTGFRDKRYTVTPPGAAGGGGLVTDHLAEKTTPYLEDAQVGKVDVSEEIYGAWRRLINEAFEDWRDLPEPGDFDTAVHAMQRVVNALPHRAVTKDGGLGSGDNGAGLALTNIAKGIGPFDGDTIQKFDENYVTRLSEYAMPGQYAVAAVLGHWVTAERLLWKETEENVDDIAQKVLAAMKSARPAGLDPDPRGLITVLGVLATAATAFVSVPAVATASTVLGLLETLVPKPSKAADPKPELGGSTPAVVFDNLQGALRQLNTAITRVEDDMWDKLGRAQGVIDGHRAQFDLASPTRLLHETDVTQILPSTTTGTLEIRQRLSVLRNVGEVLMARDLAGALQACADDCSEAMTPTAWSRPATIGFGSTGAWSTWHTLADELRYLLEDTAREVRAAGEHLSIAAQYMARTDEEIEGAMARTRARLARHARDYEDRPRVTPPVSVQPGTPAGGGDVYAI